MAAKQELGELVIDNCRYPIVNASTDEIVATGFSPPIRDKFWGRVTFVAEAFGSRFQCYVVGIEPEDTYYGKPERFTIRVTGEKVAI